MARISLQQGGGAKIGSTTLDRDQYDKYKSFTKAGEAKDYLKGLGDTDQTATTTTSTGGDGSTSEAGVISTQQAADFYKQLQGIQQQLTGYESLIEGAKSGQITGEQLKTAEETGSGIGKPLADFGVIQPDGTFAKQEEVKPEKTVTTIDTETDQTFTRTGDAATVDQQVQDDLAKGLQITDETTTGLTAEETEEDKEITRLTGELQDAIEEVNRFKLQLEDLFISDSELRGEIRAITKAYDVRIADSQDITKRRVGQIQTMGARYGARYSGGSGGVWGGMISAEEQFGLRTIADIESQKQSKIIEAKTAARNFNYKLYADLMDDAQDLADQKYNELSSLKKAQAEQDAALAEQKRTIAVDDAVVQAIQEGVTSVDEIFDYINYDDNGRRVGDVTLDEIDKALKIANPPEDLSELDGEMADWEYLKSIGDPWGELTYGEFRRAVYNATHKATGGSSDSMNKVLSVSEIDDLKGMYEDYRDQINYGMTRQQVADLVGGEVGEEGVSGEKAVNTAYEAEGYLRNEIDLKVLKRIADAEGISSWLKHKVVDVNNMFEKASDKDIIALANLFKEYSDETDYIITSLEDDITPDDILEYLKEKESE